MRSIQVLQILGWGEGDILLILNMEQRKEMFPIVGLLARFILGVMVSQIKVDTIIFMLNVLKLLCIDVEHK